MTWLTWRQLRTQAIVVYAPLAALAVVLLVTGLGLGDRSGGTDANFLQGLGSTDKTFYYVGIAVVLALPAIIGVFWGAPLLGRELESGTYRLVWSQSVTRTRWLATKVGLVGLVAAGASALLTAVVTWWCAPIDKAIGAGHPGEGILGVSRLSPLMFDARGIVPIGFALFALALGVAAGAIVRRTVPAMAVTLVVFVAVQVAVPTLVRPNLSPSTLTTPITQENLEGLIIEGPSNFLGPVRDLNVDIHRPGAWITSDRTTDGSGHAVGLLPAWVARCAPGPGPEGGRPGSPACFARLAKEGYRQRVTYQPAGSYWRLQAEETAIFLGLALLMTGSTFWWVRHRLS